MNPYGKKGCPEHQEKIQEIGEEIEKKGLIAIFEYVFKIKDGKKKKRYADVVGLTHAMKLVEIHQVGKENKNGTAVKRERDAISDIERNSNNKNIKVQFHKYTKYLILLITFGTLSILFLSH